MNYNYRMKKTRLIPYFLLFLFFIIGILIYQDFGVSTDEKNQVDAGHIIWKYLCQKTGREVPEPIRDVQDLYQYYNRYYGQAATFPTVILEAIRGFTLDISTIMRIRHLWNYLCYFAGLCCFTAFLTQITNDPLESSLGLLFMILLPRIFGDIFCNDRDTMLLAWMMISLCFFYRYLKKPGWFSALLCGLFFAVTYNTRMFGLLLLVFPLIFLFTSKHKKLNLLLILSSLCFWILVSPIYWEDPIHSIPASFTHLSSLQRYFDSQNKATVLFFGKAINESQLPWYYLPVYMFITTPLITSLTAIFGSIILGKKVISGKQDIKTRFGIGMMIMLFPFMLAVIIFHPSLYNGWRHFYFLYLPIVWLALEGAVFIFRLKSHLLHVSFSLLIICSFLSSASWMVSAHPYQIIYLNPVFRNRWLGSFSRDFWGLSCKEGMEYLLEYEEGISINVTDNDCFTNTIIGLPPAERVRFHTTPNMPQPYPIKYIFFNYDNISGNEKQFSYYAPIYTISRDGIKLAEIFQRTHNGELSISEIISEVTADHKPETAAFLADGNFDTAWENTETDSVLTLHLSNGFMLSDVEIFPLQNYPEFPDFKLFISEDGKNWKELNYERKGLNGLNFTPHAASFFRIQTSPKCPGIRDILFYGSYL